MNSRIKGLDLARSLALLGMILVNFKLVMGADTGSALLLKATGMFEGRASALFVILAGIGLSLLTSQARLSGKASLQLSARNQVLKRGGILFFLGILLTPIWPADILHFYGLYFVFAAFLLKRSDKELLGVCGFFSVIFVFLMGTFDYDSGWDWPSLTYHDLWTVNGMVRHMMFNGFHPLFPWGAFLVLGMWLGRQPLTDLYFQKYLVKISMCVLLSVEIVMWLLRFSLLDGSESYETKELENLLFTQMIPPLPPYILSASSSAVLVLVFCLWLGRKFEHNSICHCMENAGKQSLTWYVMHIVLGMGTLEFFSMLGDQSIEAAVLASGLFFTVCILVSTVWLNCFKEGPLETILRKLVR